MNYVTKHATFHEEMFSFGKSAEVCIYLNEDSQVAGGSANIDKTAPEGFSLRYMEQYIDVRHNNSSLGTKEHTASNGNVSVSKETDGMDSV